MKRFLLTLITGILLLGHLIPLAQANSQNTIQTCPAGSQFDEIAYYDLNVKNKSYILTEIYEPIGSLNQKITDGTVTLSQVFWKYTCETDVKRENEYDENGNIIGIQETNIKTIKVSGYVNYESGCPSGAQCSLVQIIVGQTGTGILKTYITIMYRWAASVVGIVAVLVIVISGIQISVDQGGGEQVSQAKTRIMQSLAGLVLLFLSALLLYTINPTFFSNSILNIPEANAQNMPTIPKPDFLPGPEEGMGAEETRNFVTGTVIPKFISQLIGIMGGLSMVAIVWAGVRFATAFGEEEAVSSAKKIATWAVIGFAIAILSYSIVATVNTIDLPSDNNQNEQEDVIYNNI